MATEFSDEKRGSIVRLADGLVRLRAPVTRAAVSPDGRYVAWTQADNVASGELVVMDVPTGEDVVRLCGPTVRHVEWCSPARLLVVREGEIGARRMTLHELPDGGALAGCAFPEALRSADRVELSRDARHVCVHDVCYAPYVSCVYSLPELALAGSIERKREMSVTDVALHPDGHELAVLTKASGGTNLAVLSARDGTVRQTAKITGVKNVESPEWATPSRLTLSIGENNDTAVVARPDGGDEVAAVTVSKLVSSKGFAFARVATSPTRAALVGVVQSRSLSDARAIMAVDVGEASVLARGACARVLHDTPSGAVSVDGRLAAVALPTGAGTTLAWIDLERGKVRVLDVPDSRMSHGAINARVLPTGFVPVLEPLSPRARGGGRVGSKVLLMSLDALRAQGKAAAG